MATTPSSTPPLKQDCWGPFLETLLGEPTSLGAALTDFVNYEFGQGHKNWRGEKLLAGIIFHSPRYGKNGYDKLPRTLRALKGWRRASPSRSRRPLTVGMWVAIVVEIARLGFLMAALLTLIMVEGCLRPGEMLGLTPAFFLPPAPGGVATCVLLLVPQEGNLRSKTGESDDSIPLDSRRCGWMEAIYQGRHAGTSADRAENLRTQEQVVKRGRWQALRSVRRCEKAGRVNQAWRELDVEDQDHVRFCMRMIEGIFRRGGVAPTPPYFRRGAEPDPKRARHNIPCALENPQTTRLWANLSLNSVVVAVVALLLLSAIVVLVLALVVVFVACLLVRVPVVAVVAVVAVVVVAVVCLLVRVIVVAVVVAVVVRVLVRVAVVALAAAAVVCLLVVDAVVVVVIAAVVRSLARVAAETVVAVAAFGMVWVLVEVAVVDDVRIVRAAVVRLLAVVAAVVCLPVRVAVVAAVVVVAVVLSSLAELLVLLESLAMLIMVVLRMLVVLAVIVLMSVLEVRAVLVLIVLYVVVLRSSLRSVLDVVVLSVMVLAVVLLRSALDVVVLVILAVLVLLVVVLLVSKLVVVLLRAGSERLAFAGVSLVNRRAQQVNSASLMNSRLPHEQARSAAATADDTGTEIALEDGSPARRIDSRRSGRGSGSTACPSTRGAPQDVVLVLANPSSVPTSTSPTCTESSRPSSPGSRSERPWGVQEVYHRHWSTGSSSAEDSESMANATSDLRPQPEPDDDQQPEPRGVNNNKTVRRRELRVAARRRRAVQRQAQAQDSAAAAPLDGPDGAPSGAEGSAGDGFAAAAADAACPGEGSAGKAAAGRASSSACTESGQGPGKAPSRQCRFQQQRLLRVGAAGGAQRRRPAAGSARVVLVVVVAPFSEVPRHVAPRVEEILLLFTLGIDLKRACGIIL
ncbi:unnamed protein product [Prorocentrum cordatum]|uniref:Uncharacterized protein n=1 Tax=Prorocentrum cordatum TaxID=2364126 RepID=A0ABN9XWF7_9DINO|nr:unnamed protein product [Polarella glacialis]